MDPAQLAAANLIASTAAVPGAPFDHNSAALAAAAAAAAAIAASSSSAPPSTVPAGIHPSRLAAGINPLLAVSSGAASSPMAAMVAASSSSAASLNMATVNGVGNRQARRSYVGGLPFGTQENELKQLFNQAMSANFPQLVGVNSPGQVVECVVSVYLNLEKKFGFVEFRTMEECTASMQLDGIMFQSITLKVRRPSDYNEALWPKWIPPRPLQPQFSGSALAFNSSSSSSYGSNLSSNPFAPTASSPFAAQAALPPGVISNMVQDGPNKVFCGGLPYGLSENEVKDLLQAFGALKAFHLVKDKDTGVSKGFAFFEYADGSVTDEAIRGLNGIKIGDRTLTLRRAQPGGPPGSAAAEMATSVSDLATMTPSQLAQLAVNKAQGGGGSAASLLLQQGGAGFGVGMLKAPTRILVLANMVTPEELSNDNEYQEIKLDVESELRKYGNLRSCIIPRPVSGQVVPGLGRVFVEYSLPNEATRARQEVEGRQFGNSVVACDYFDENKYAQGQLD